jgi:2-dehydropantoate 2-reductase
VKIVFVGAGGVGGYFGAKLAQAGAEVSLVARGAHLDAIKRQGGLKIVTAAGESLAPVRASDDPAKLGPADLIGIATKLWDTESVIGQITPLMTPATRVVSFQNGIEAPDMLREAFGAERVLGGIAQISTVISEPGTIKQTGAFARLTIGTFGPTQDPVAVKFADIAKSTGVDVALSPDISRSIWEKFVFLASFAAITAVTRLPKGGVWSREETRALFRALVAEAVELARAEGIDFDDTQIDKVIANVEGMPDGMKASMLHDLEKGGRLELPWLSGAVVRRSRAKGMAALSHAFVVAALAPYAEGRPSFR